MSATENNDTAFVAMIDLSNYEISFATEPIRDGCIFYATDDRVSLSDLEKDGWAECIAAPGEEDCPELRRELAGILERRFESTREAEERQERIGDKREKAGLPRREFPIGAPASPVTLKMVQRAQYDSEEVKTSCIDFFKRYGCLPEKYDDDDGGEGDGKPLPPLVSEAPAQQPAVIVEDKYPEPMREEAFYGIAGDFVRLVQPQTEADPVALLGNFLVAAGLLFSREAWVVADGKNHYPVEYLLMAGDSGVGRKGTATNRVVPLMDQAAMFYHNRVLSGLSTGEGLVRALQPKPAEDPNSVRWFLAIIQEFASLLSVMKREGNTMSAILREAYDGGRLRVLTRKDPLQVNNVNLAVIAHITPEELLNNLTDTDRVNGFANRFLTICVKRSQYLPEGGEDVTFDDIVEKLKTAVEKAQRRGRIYRDAEAKKLWAKHYPILTRKRVGLSGALSSRAETHVMRLSLIYALLDGAEAIGVQHLKAALAFWNYVEDSIGYIYRAASGDSAADKIIAAMVEGPITKKEISRLFGDHRKADWIDAKVQSLMSQGLIEKSMKQTGNGLRESWGLKMEKK